jgi:hypothetical protein
MMTRITVGGVLAGLVMFFWSFIAHMVLPIGSMGLSSTPGEDAVLAAMKTNASTDGMYFLPGYEYMQSLSKPMAEQQKAMEAIAAKSKRTGSALIIYHAEGSPEVAGKTLGLEFLSDIVACWIFAFALWAAMPRIPSFGMRVWLVTIMGLLPFVVCDFSYWNWYGYPGRFMLAEVLDYSIGAVFAGMMLAWWLGRGERVPDRESVRMAA